MRVVALALAASVALASAALADSRQYTFVYRMSMSGIDVGVVTDTVTLEKGSYRIESKAIAEGLAAVFFGGEFTRVSEGSYDPERGLRPSGYAQTYGGDERSARFDWDAGTLSLSWPGGERSVELRAGEGSYHDRLSFLYQPLAKCDATPGLYRVTDGKRLSEYRYEAHLGEETSTPLGTVRVMRLERVSESKKSELRLASDREMAPLSFRAGGGGGYEFVLLSADGVSAECRR